MAFEYHFESQGIQTPDNDGVGIAHTKWDMVYVGHGSSRNEAAEEAIEDAATDGIDSTLIAGIVIPASWVANASPDRRNLHGDCEPCNECSSCLSYTPEERKDRLDECLLHQQCDLYYYVALFVKDVYAYQQQEEQKKEESAPGHTLGVIMAPSPATGETTYRLTCSCNEYFLAWFRVWELRRDATRHLREQMPISLPECITSLKGVN
jgi:hypothetical protein